MRREEAEQIVLSTQFHPAKDSGCGCGIPNCFVRRARLAVEAVLRVLDLCDSTTVDRPSLTPSEVRIAVLGSAVRAALAGGSPAEAAAVPQHRYDPEPISTTVDAPCRYCRQGARAIVHAELLPSAAPAPAADETPAEEAEPHAFVPHYPSGETCSVWKKQTSRRWGWYCNLTADHPVHDVQREGR